MSKILTERQYLLVSPAENDSHDGTLSTPSMYAKRERENQAESDRETAHSSLIADITQQDLLLTLFQST